MYSLAQRPDSRVVDEPLYAHYLLRQPTLAEHPGRKAIIASQDGNGENVIREMLTADYGQPAVFFKQMTHHLIELEYDFLDQMDNVLLIRDPRSLFNRLQKSGKLTAVVDARLLLQNPKGVLTSLCERLDMPFYEQMMRWDAGPRLEDGVWAPHWYGNVHKSTGFNPWREKAFELNPATAAIAEDCRPAYETMLKVALRG